jgi:hypothetical protein
MMTSLTESQMTALRYYAQDGVRTGKMPAVSTEHALLRKRLISERQATEGEKRAAGRDVALYWRITELTGTGRTLLGQITEAPTDGPKIPDDPFAGIPGC